MSIVKPFKSVRPSRELASKVAALPYDVMDSDEAREMVKDNPYSFLHIDKAEIDLDRDIDVYDKKVYEKARDNIKEFLDKKIFIKDNEKYFYIYRLVMGDVTQTGLVGAASIDDYINDNIKKHEFTREVKEQDRINHVDYCNANTGPIFLTYRTKESLTKLIDEWTKKTPEYDFVSEDNVKHTVWVVDDKKTIEKIEKEFSEIENLYIADGHHRAASAVKVGLKRRNDNKNYDGSEEFNYFLSVIFPSDELNIMDYNRVIKDLNGLSKEEFLAKLEKIFTVKKYEGQGQLKPSKKHQFGLYLDNDWYELNLKDNVADESDTLKSLDVSILSDYVINPILGIENQRTSDRIDFVGGIRGLKELERRVDNKENVLAFAFYPTSIDDLMKIADSGRVMPPKSTWFEPKLRSGLFIHELD